MLVFVYEKTPCLEYCHENYQYCSCKKSKTLNVYNTKAVSLGCKLLYPYVTKLHFRTSEALNNGSFNWLQEHRFSNEIYDTEPTIAEFPEK